MVILAVILIVISNLAIMSRAAPTDLTFRDVMENKSPKLQACGSDLRRLLDWLCTYPNEKLPCYQHFMEDALHKFNSTKKHKENPLNSIEKMKTEALAAEDYEEFINSETGSPTEKTLIETCCFGGCAIAELKKNYCCFSQDCLELCYPGEFDIYKKR